MMDLYDALVALMSELKVFRDKRKAELHKNHLYTGSDMERSAFWLTTFKYHSLNEATLSFVIYTDNSQQEIQDELHDIIVRLESAFSKYGVETSGFQQSTRYFQYGETDQSDGGADIMSQS